MYHSIATAAQPRFRRWVVAPTQFAAQLAFLAAEGYTTITVSQLRAAIAGDAALPPRPVALTFDDGFADFHATVLPLLDERRMTATLYLTTGYVDGTSLWLAREGEGNRLLLTWDQIRGAIATGIEIGAHTHTHPELDVLPAHVAAQEITLPRQVIAAQTGLTVESFAYPFGYFSRANRRAVQAAGYTSACAVKYAMSAITDDPLALSRLIVTADTTPDGFVTLLTTPTSLRARVRERARARVWRAVRQARSITQGKHNR